MQLDRNLGKSLTRVLIVDDSPTMRLLLRKVLEADPEIDVVGAAGDAYEARQAIKALNPDVVTLDIEMPGMDGLAFLRKIMALRPMPVVMVSSLTDRGAKCAIEAMSIGAVDCIGKPTGGDLQAGMSPLRQIIKTAARARVRQFQPPQKPSVGAGLSPGSEAREFDPSKVIAIGASTGGVEALCEILRDWPRNCPPTLIVQHMPAQFTPSFAARLNQISGAVVSEAEDQARLESGRVYLAPGGDYHLKLETRAGLRCRLFRGEAVNGHRPSADVLFESVAPLGDRGVGLILTGLGSDGAKGLKSMRDAGAQTIGQDKESCTVYGMPRAAHACGAVARQLPLERIAAATLDLCIQRRR